MSPENIEIRLCLPGRREKGRFYKVYEVTLATMTLKDSMPFPPNENHNINLIVYQRVIYKLSTNLREFSARNLGHFDTKTVKFRAAKGGKKTRFEMCRSRKNRRGNFTGYFHGENDEWNLRRNSNYTYVLVVCLVRYWISGIRRVSSAKNPGCFIPLITKEHRWRNRSLDWRWRVFSGCNALGNQRNRFSGLATGLRIGREAPARFPTAVLIGRPEPPRCRRRTPTEKMNIVKLDFPRRAGVKITSKFDEKIVSTRENFPERLWTT